MLGEKQQKERTIRLAKLKFVNIKATAQVEGDELSLIFNCAELNISIAVLHR